MGGSCLGSHAYQEQQVLLGLQGHSTFLGDGVQRQLHISGPPSPLPGIGHPVPAHSSSAASTLLLHSPTRVVTRLLSPVSPSGSSVPSGSWVVKARAPQGPLSGPLLWGCSLSLMLAASLGRMLGSLEAFFLLTVFLPCRGGQERPTVMQTFPVVPSPRGAGCWGLSLELQGKLPTAPLGACSTLCFLSRAWGFVQGSRPSRSCSPWSCSLPGCR